MGLLKVFRLKRSSKPYPHNHDYESEKQIVYAPPPYPPPLRHVVFPLIDPAQSLYLSFHGWASVPFTRPADPLFSALQHLLAASKTFFALSQEEKTRFNFPAADSEEGWSRIEGEKELITLRSDAEDRLPAVLREPAKECWRLCGELLNKMVEGVEESLGMENGSLTAFSEPCLNILPEKTATMLRLFRYEGSFAEEQVVAERMAPFSLHSPTPLKLLLAHNDLGLLSLVMGDVPGLQVWNRFSQSWFPIEESYTTPTASVLTGRQLSALTNGRYAPGPHRVVAPASSAPFDKEVKLPKYRYSLVFILRAHNPVPISTAKLTTVHTGPFANSMEGMTAGDLHRQISSTCYNINTQKEKREIQRAKMRGRKTGKDSQETGGVTTK